MNLNSLDLPKRPQDTRVVVAMSGGVDSSVVAGLLAREGYDVVGVTLQLYDHGEATHRKGACCAGQDIHDARRVAAAGELKREHESVLKVRIVSAFPMNDAEKNELVQALAKKYGKKIEAEVAVDQSLIGGANIEIGDEVIHASVRDTLDKMAIALSH